MIAVSYRRVWCSVVPVLLAWLELKRAPIMNLTSAVSLVKAQSALIDIMNPLIYLSLLTRLTVKGFPQGQTSIAKAHSSS